MSISTANEIKRFPLPPTTALPPIIKLELLARISSPVSTIATAPNTLSDITDRTSEKYWDDIRSQFLLTSGLTFLNNGTYSPPPRVVLQEIDDWHRGLAFHPARDVVERLTEEVRNRTAEVVNADPDEIALTRSTTEGINLLVEGIDWQEGDEILLEKHDHFTAFQSFLRLTGRHGVKLVFVDVGDVYPSEEAIVEKYATLITPRTRLVFLNFVNYRTGWRMPVEALAALGRKHGAIVSVDAAQAFGAIDIDLKKLDIDHLAAPSHKWILGGPGAGFTYFSKRIIDQVWPTAGAPRADDETAHTTARKFDQHGPKNIPSIMGFSKALEFHNEIGGDAFRSRLAQLSDQLRSGLQDLSWGSLLTPLEPTQTSALTTFHVGDNRSADEVAAILYERYKIKVNSQSFAELNALRISPHIFTTPAQIDYLVDVLRRL